MCHPHCSHIFMSQGARAFVVLSRLFLVFTSSPICGVSSPMRVFQSPHIATLFSAGILLNMSSTKLRAVSSSVPRFYRFYTGGRYTFPTHIFAPPGTCMHMPYAYSFPVYLIILIPFLIRMAIPPLWPLLRRCSNT
jgi:hypothetical protein